MVDPMGKRALIVSLVFAAALTPATAGAAKKKPKANMFAATKSVGAPVPEGPAPAALPAAPLKSTIVVPKKFKGKAIGDLDVTGITTTGSGAGAAGQLVANLTAPNGRTVELFRTVGDQSIGPWTLNDETPTSICNATAGTACGNPDQSLGRPFAGTTNLLYNIGGQFPSSAPLSIFDGIAMRGTWTLTVADLAPTGGLTSTLGSWGLKIRAAKPVSG